MVTKEQIAKVKAEARELQEKLQQMKLEKELKDAQQTVEYFKNAIAEEEKKAREFEDFKKKLTEGK